MPQTAATDALSRPRLKPTIDLFPAPDGDLYLLRDHASDVAIRSPGPGERALLAGLDGRRTVRELFSDLRAAGHDLDEGGALASIGQLRAAGLVEDATGDDRLDAAVRERFDRQLRYFGDLSRPDAARADVQLRLASSAVLVLGVGGLGSWTAYALTCTGLGRLTLVDGDHVDSANLNRQILFAEGDVGRPKAFAAARRLRAFSSHTEIVSVERMVADARDAARLVEGHDVVVLLADMPVGDVQRWVDRACFATGVPYLVAGQYPPLVRVGPLYVPGRTACHTCEEAAWRERHPLYDAVARWRRDRPSEAAAFGPTCGLIGSLLANEVVNLVTGLAEPALAGRALLFDANTLEQRFEALPPRGGCPRCGDDAFHAYSGQ